MGRDREYIKMNEKLFWDKVKKESEGCWKWLGATDHHGYGQMRVNGHNVQAHRISWLIHNDVIPKGICILHRCDNPECTRPDHLYSGTLKDNSRDMIQKGRGRGQFIRGQAGKSSTICKRGHLKEAGKNCRICQVIRGSAYRKRLYTKRPPRTCPVCGKHFPNYGKKLYCSKNCKWKFANNKRRL